MFFFQSSCWSIVKKFYLQVSCIILHKDTLLKLPRCVDFLEQQDWVKMQQKQTKKHARDVYICRAAAWRNNFKSVNVTAVHENVAQNLDSLSDKHCFITSSSIKDMLDVVCLYWTYDVVTTMRHAPRQTVLSFEKSKVSIASVK